jgi:hypothetical protein
LHVVGIESVRRSGKRIEIAKIIEGYLALVLTNYGSSRMTIALSEVLKEFIV